MLVDEATVHALNMHLLTIHYVRMNNFHLNINIWKNLSVKN